jgi:hypothetical protein
MLSSQNQIEIPKKLLKSHKLTSELQLLFMLIAMQNMAPHLPDPITLWLVSFALDERNLQRRRS